MQPFTQSNTCVEVPSALQAYRADIAQFRRLSPLEESELVERARSGDAQARIAFVESCQRYIHAVAARLANYYYSSRDVALDVLDIAQEGSLWLVEHMGKVLAHPTPCPYMRLSVRCIMLNYCKEHRSIIRTPRTKGAAPHRVMSLDAPLHEGDDVTLLDLVASDRSV